MDEFHGAGGGGGRYIVMKAGQIKLQLHMLKVRE